MTFSPIRRTTAILAAAGLAAAGLLATQASAATINPSTLSASAITATLSKDASIPGTAWQTNPDGRIIVSYDDTVTGAKMSALTGVTKQFGNRVTLEKIPGKLTKYIAGGDAIYGGQYRCSLGFNVRSGSTYYFLTAGHCGNIASTWYANSSQTTLLGHDLRAELPGQRLRDRPVQHAYTNHPGTVDLYNGSLQDITSAGNAVRRPVGQAQRQHHRCAQRLGHRAERHGELRRGHASPA